MENARDQFDNRKMTGSSVKEIINVHGDRESMKEEDSHRHFSELSSSKTRELHFAKRDIGRLKEIKRVAETTTAHAESDLFNAKKTVSDLTSGIQEINFRTKFQRKRDNNSNGGRRYAEIMNELEQVKRELSKLKLDMAVILEEKNRAEKTSRDALLKMKSNSTSMETIRREIEFVNEEQVLVELARIEAAKELAAIESQRKEEEARLSAKVEDKRKKMAEMSREIESSKEVEAKLAITTSDINMLQTQLELVREMDKMESLGEEKSTEMKSVSEELEAAKKELASVKAEGFQFMTSMDIIRDELKHVMEEIDRLKKTEDKADLKIQNLNSKLIRAKGKLEVVTSAEEKTKSLVSNLAVTLEQLRTETEAAEKERDLVNEETENIKAEIQKSEADIDLTEVRLQAAIQELEAVKTSEAMALENLKHLVESSMRSRASTSKQSSEITISNLEYEYLTGRAKGAEEIADKKVAASRAWIEALKASEKEMVMKTEMAQKNVNEMRAKEENETSKTLKSLTATKMVEEELWNWKEQSEKNVELGKRRSSVNMTPARRARFRKVSSPGFRVMPRSNSTVARRKKNGIPHLTRLFSGKSGEQE
ncbi:protein PLASTID MOVEMENT IMPAIRED 2 [Impatiens glandulifera]|uniref:protein PLASTID MOVEMENT IMPAIRED 2 n=1 Tax=Impatiens glandulifera TaxID=253017 RepID=UPI001FB0FE8C|nr:protein PLASTID MOVEMENT IMPAIRED 2 [Impatiens glandulifera]